MFLFATPVDIAIDKDGERVEMDVREISKGDKIFNKYDPCCFSGLGFKTYESEIKNTVSSLGKGTFDIFLDETNNKHSISDESLGVILKDMER